VSFLSFPCRLTACPNPLFKVPQSGLFFIGTDGAFLATVTLTAGCLPASSPPAVAERSRVASVCHSIRAALLVDDGDIRAAATIRALPARAPAHRDFLVYMGTSLLLGNANIEHSGKYAVGTDIVNSPMLGRCL
jgi:hypothetical protein